MNPDVFLLFFNAFLAVAIAAVIVYRILKKEYALKIKELEEKENDKKTRQ